VTDQESKSTVSISEKAWKALEGAYDLHVHVAPDIIERSIDDIGLAREFFAHRMRGFVLKSHYIPTTERAAVVTKAVPGVIAYGAITLNHSIGGLNPVAIEIAGRGGCKMVWMPTVDAANETAGRNPGGKHLPFWAKIQLELAATGISPPPISVLYQDGTITGPARSCLELISKHEMVLATGHLSRKEIYKLVETSREMGLRRVIVTHAEFPSQNLSTREQVELAEAGAYIEHCFTTMHSGKAPWDSVIASIRQVGAHRCVLSTDLGQPVNPPVVEGFAMFAQRLLEAGFSVDELRAMTVDNPAALLS
jgi:hypothetical protein